MIDTKANIEDGNCKSKGMAERGFDQARGAAQAAGEMASDAMGAVKEKAQEVAAGASELAGRAKDKAQDWASSIGASAVQAKDKAQHVASEAVEKAGDLGQDVTALIRRYPMPALLVGVGVGFLLGQMLRSRSSSGA